MLVSQFEALGKTSGEFFAVRDYDQDRFGIAMRFEQQAGNDIRRLLIEVTSRLITQQ
jgi:hypothetical protein